MNCLLFVEAAILTLGAVIFGLALFQNSWVFRSTLAIIWVMFEVIINILVAVCIYWIRFAHSDILLPRREEYETVV